MTANPSTPETAPDVVAEPKWVATARRRIKGARIKVGSDIHLLEMALHDYEEECARADTLAAQVTHARETEAVATSALGLALEQRDALAGEVERLKAATDYFEATMLDQQAKRERAESALSAMTARAAAYRTALAAALRWDIRPGDVIHASWSGHPEDHARALCVADAMVALFVKEAPDEG